VNRSVIAAAFTDLEWESIATRLVGAVLFTLIFAWLLRRARGQAVRVETTDVFVLRYSGWWKALFAVSGLATLGLLAATYAFQPPSEWDPPASDALPIGIFGGGALLSLTGFLEMAKTQVEVSSYGVVLSSPWRGRRHLAWHQIDAITYSPTLMWFVLHGNEGTRLRVHHMLQGIPTFGAHVREQLDESIYRPAARFFDVSLGAL